MPMTGAAPIAAPGWTAQKETGVRIVDCDVHHSFESPDQLLPYLSRFYQEHLYDQGLTSPAAVTPTRRSARRATTSRIPISSGVTSTSASSSPSRSCWIAGTSTSPC